MLYKTAAVAAFVSALTTLGVHLITFHADTPEARMALANNSLYNFRLGLVIFHCLCVIVSMYGFAAKKFKDAPGWFGLGLLAFVVFGLTEITRMFAALCYLNGLRRRYLAATEEAVRTHVQQSLDNWALASTTMFTLFIFAFAVGNLCYGAGLLGSARSRFDRTLAWLLLVWAGLTGLNFASQFFPMGWVEPFMEWVSPTFQPFVRTVIGLWLWGKWQSRADVLATHSSGFQ